MSKTTLFGLPETRTCMFEGRCTCVESSSGSHQHVGRYEVAACAKRRLGGQIATKCNVSPSAFIIRGFHVSQELDEGLYIGVRIDCTRMMDGCC